MSSRTSSVRREIPSSFAASVWLPAQRSSASMIRWRSAWKDPANRFQTIEDLIARFELLLEDIDTQKVSNPRRR